MIDTAAPNGNTDNIQQSSKEMCGETLRKGENPCHVSDINSKEIVSHGLNEGTEELKIS